MPGSCTFPPTIILATLLKVLNSVCILAIVQVVYISSAIHDTDQTRSRIALTALNQCIMNVSIITATVPSIHRSLVDLQTGHIGTRIPQSQIDRAYPNDLGITGSSSHEMKSGSSGKGRSKVLSIPSRIVGGTKGSQNRDNTNGQAGQSNQQFRPEGEGDNTTRVEHDPGNMAETGSRTSDGSEKMIIRQTVGWDVRYDDGK